jgi:hypothetical protein
MRLSKKDWVLIFAIIIVVVAIIAAIAGKKYNITMTKGKLVPNDIAHAPFYQLILSPISSSRSAVAKGCENCHCVYAYPLPKDHPPEKQCLKCHAMTKG